MLYIFGTYLKKNKNIKTALSYIYGINNKKAEYICNYIGLGNKYKIKNLTNTQIYYIKNTINKHELFKNKETKDLDLTNDLKRYIKSRIKRHIEIKSYKGTRHKLSYPVRGQRTHTNAQTQKKLSRLRLEQKSKK
jgi:small subunit ribosomal protein S13